MSAASANHKTPIYKVLYFQVICAIVIGILLGFLAPEIGAQMKPFGDGFIRLIKMIIAPVIFCTVVTGIAGMEDMKKVGKYGSASLLPLAKLMGTFYLTCLLFIFGVLGTICRIHGFSIMRYISYIKEELLIVLGTSSSESVLPRMMTKMELAGVSRSVVGLVIPTGYSFNLDGTAIYLTMAAVFIAQACDVSMTLTQQLTLLAVLLLTSKGAAGVTGSGFIVLAATLSAVGHVPVAGLALILGIDRFMSEARALTNMIGNGIACVVVGHWCREVDNDKLKVVMHSKKKYHENEDAS